MSESKENGRNRKWNQQNKQKEEKKKKEKETKKRGNLPSRQRVISFSSSVTRPSITDRKAITVHQSP